MKRRLLPPQPSQLAHSLKNLAITLSSQGKLAEVESPLRERVELGRADVERQRREPSSLEQRIYELADNLYDQQKFPEADPLYRELIQRRSRRMVAEDEDLLSSKASLARSLTDWAWLDISEQSTNASQALQRAKEAEGILRGCLDTWLQTTNRNHWRVSDVRSRLGGTLLSVAMTDPTLQRADLQARFSEIEELLIQGHEGLMSTRSPGTKRQRGSFERFIRLYDVWNKPAQATYWRAKLATFDRAEKAKTASADVVAPTAPPSPTP